MSNKDSKFIEVENPSLLSKYRLVLTLAHQYLEQMERPIQRALFGNVGTLLAYRVGAVDAAALAVELEPHISATYLQNLGPFEAVIKLTRGGNPQQPMPFTGFPPPQPAPNERNKDNIIKTSRERYGRKRTLVEDRIARWQRMARPSKRTDDAKGQGSGVKPKFF